MTSRMNAVAGVAPGLSTYALASIAPSANRVRLSCAMEPWQDGAEAVVRFSPPSAGRWRLTARGEHVGALGLARNCGASEAACAGFADYHGAHITAAASLDVLVQRGESLSVTIDGCPDGVTCAWELRAERIGALECPPFSVNGSPCATGLACTIDRCEPERFVCVPEVQDRLASARIFADRTLNAGFVVGTMVAAPAGSRRAMRSSIMAVWRPGAGTDSYLGGEARDDVGFTLGPTTIPASAASARMWLLDGNRPLEAQRADGIDVTVEAWSPRRESAPCDAALLERCAAGLRCVTEGANTRGACARSQTIELTSLRAWRDPQSRSLRLRMEGQATADRVSQAQVDVVNAAGVTLASLPAFTVYGAHEPPSYVPFSATAELTMDALLRVLPDAAGVRVRAIDTSGRTSPPGSAAIMVTAEAAVGDACTDVSTTCASGLACVTPAVGAARCEPAVRRPCELPALTGTWAPPSSGTYTLDGTSRGFGGSTSCAASRVSAGTAAEFVAPTSGAYVFETRGLYVIEVRRGCDAPSPTPTCVTGPEAPRVEVTLAAGERVALAVMARMPGTPFTVTARVP